MFIKCYDLDIEEEMLININKIVKIYTCDDGGFIIYTERNDAEEIAANNITIRGVKTLDELFQYLKLLKD